MLARPLLRTSHPRPVTPISDDTKAIGANTWELNRPECIGKAPRQNADHTLAYTCWNVCQTAHPVVTLTYDVFSIPLKRKDSAMLLLPKRMISTCTVTEAISWVPDDEHG